ncbi:MAG: CoA transferase [Chloroflexota bacterium]
MIKEGPLSGIRILDFSRVLAGPYGTLLLADLGADVIKVEQEPSQAEGRSEAYGTAWSALYGLRPPEGSQMSDQDLWFLRRGESHYQSLNRNKKRLSINMETEKGKEVFYELVKQSDVVFDNFRPAMLKIIGIDFDTLVKINPKIVSVSVSGFGETGPWADAPAYDIVNQASTGVMRGTGFPDKPPCVCGLPIGDVGAGVFGSFAVMVGLAARDRTGKGQRVDISMMDVLVSLTSYQIGNYAANKDDIPRPRGSGLSGGGQIPYGAYECKDNTWVAIAAGTPRHWQLFMEGLGLPELAKDPRFDNVEKRKANEPELYRIIMERLKTKTAKEWEKIFFDKKLPTSVVNTLPEMLEHPQVLARKMVVPVKLPSGEEWKFAGNPVKVRGFEESYECIGIVGENSDEILADLLGYSKEQAEDLKKQKVIWYPDTKTIQ